MTRASRLFFHVQHLLGIGHQVRAAALTRACVQAGIDVHYASGGFGDHTPDLGGATHHQLPPVRVRDADFSKLEDETGTLIDAAWWTRRTDATLALFAETAPDLLLLEGFPFARRKFATELVPLIDAARARNVPVLTSVRDILVAPADAKKRDKAIRLAADRLDHILVHGDPAFCPLEASFPGIEAVKDKLVYTGYADGAFDTKLPVRKDNGDILISVGGGAVGGRLIEAVLDAIPPAGLDGYRWRFLMGPNLPDEAAARLKRQADRPDIIVEPARPDFRHLLQDAALSISQAGYNTVMDLTATGCPAIVVPFARGNETEQTARAKLLDRAGYLRMIPEAACSGQTLADAIAEMLARGRADRQPPFSLNGARNTAVFLKALWRSRR